VRNCVVVTETSKSIDSTAAEETPIPNPMKETNMNPIPTLPNCDKELHLRIPKEFEMHLARVACAYNLKKSTFARMLLIRELHNYDKSRLFA